MIEIEKFYKCFKFNFTDKDIIKRNNQFYLSLDSEGLFYIRDFCNNNYHIDIDDYYYDYEIQLINENIYENIEQLNCYVDNYKYNVSPTTVVLTNASQENEKYLTTEKYLIIGINESLRKYSNKINLYLCNNPYESALDFYPKDSPNDFPDALFSFRTNPKLVSMYKGSKYGFNTPISSKRQEILVSNNHTINLEDHRSIILSLFNLVYYFRNKNIVFPNIPNYLKEERSGTVYIKDGIYMYPQQIIETSIVSAGIFWLKKYGINVYICNKDYDFIENLKTIDSEKIINGIF